MTRPRILISVVSLGLFAGTGLLQAQFLQAPPVWPHAVYGQADWNTPPSDFAAARQRGYKDGIEGARRDFENHRPPNVDNRDEYRDPKFIASPDRRDYRIGFRRGYEVAVRHMYGHGPR